MIGRGSTSLVVQVCGIAGFLDSNAASSGAEATACVEAMTRAIAHRGPDDSGNFVDAAAGIALGHRRLSIIDLSPLGHQPMTSADGRYVITYNGEVYNFAELRTQLEALGHKFRGGSDMGGACRFRRLGDRTGGDAFRRHVRRGRVGHADADASPHP
jgi:glutamine phosphoribosylpyrophosphate amidotransferase